MPLDLDFDRILGDPELFDKLLDQLEWSATDSAAELESRTAALDEVLSEAVNGNERTRTG